MNVIDQPMTKIHLVADGDTVQVNQSLWATQLADDTYRLENIPVFSELAYQDVVKCECINGLLTATEFVADGGNSSETWQFDEITPEQIEHVSNQLTDKGIKHERVTDDDGCVFFLNIANEADADNAQAIWSNQSA